MAKKDKSSELEHLRGLVRNQKSIIKNLKKEISRSNKRQYQFQENDEEESELEFSLPETKQFDYLKCPDCNQRCNSTELGSRILITCDNCGYRKSRKNG